LINNLQAIGGLGDHVGRQQTSPIVYDVPIGGGYIPSQPTSCEDYPCGYSEPNSYSRRYVVRQSVSSNRNAEIDVANEVPVNPVAPAPVYNQQPA